MLSHAWSVLCNRVIQDAETGNLSVDIVERMQIAADVIPTDAMGVNIVARLELVSAWYRANPEQAEIGRCRVRLLNPPGDELGRLEANIDLSNALRARVRSKFEVLPVTGPGFYYFVIERQDGSQWTEQARIPLQVTVSRPEEMPAV